MESVEVPTGLTLPALALNPMGKLAMPFPFGSAAATASCHVPVAEPPFAGVPIITNEATAATVRVCGPDVPPPGLGLLTVICSLPAVTTLAAGTDAVSCVDETKVVVSAVPLRFATDVEMKFDPASVIVVFGEPAATTDGDSEVNDG